MSPDTGVTPQVRAVLSAPRGRRFSRTAHPTPRTQTQRPLTRTDDDPWTTHSQEYTRLARSAYLQAARKEEHRRRAREASTAPENPHDPWKPSPAPQHPTPVIPRPRPAPDDGPPPPDPPRPPLPRRPRRPHSHRKPRHRRRSHAGWHLFGYTLATVAGALAHHLAPFLP